MESITLTGDDLANVRQLVQIAADALSQQASQATQIAAVAQETLAKLNPADA